jgi:hypothetical protein
MTARAGDALLHVQFQAAASADFQALVDRESAAAIWRSGAMRSGRVGRKLIGSARICMATMSRRKGPGFLHPPFTCASLGHNGEELCFTVIQSIYFVRTKYYGTSIV